VARLWANVDLAMWRPWKRQERAGTRRRVKGTAGEKRSPPELPEKQIAIVEINARRRLRG
jgi:hypothetical protein